MKTTDEPQSYQQVLHDKMLAGGFRPSELTLFTSGRSTGKSMLNAMYAEMVSRMSIPQPNFEINSKAEVDGAIWYTVSCNKEVSTWLRSQPKELHLETLAHKPAVMAQFDIHEKLYTAMALRW